MIHSEQTEQRITAYNKFVLAINYPLVYNNLGKQTHLSYKLCVIENVCMFAEKDELIQNLVDGNRKSLLISVSYDIMVNRSNVSVETVYYSTFSPSYLYWL